MRDPKRINRISKLIGKIWRKYPGLRLCQLIGNCFKLRDLYYVEDNRLEQRLKEVYLNRKLYTPEDLEKVSKEFKKILRKIDNV